MDEKSFTNFIQDWIDSNPTIKKKFQILGVYFLPKQIIEITTSPTTKSNQDFLKKYLLKISTDLNVDVKQVVFTDRILDIDFESIIKNYIKSTGLLESEYSLVKKKVGDRFFQYDAILDIDVLKFIKLKNFHYTEGSLFTYEILDRKLKNNFTFNFKFNPSIKKSLIELNDKMIDFIQNDANHTFLGKTHELPKFSKDTQPTLGFFNNSNSLTVFVTERKEIFANTILKKGLNSFFEPLGIKEVLEWVSNTPNYHLYTRGPWVKKEDIAFGFVNPYIFLYDKELFV